jgi:hypothetical protein
VTKFYAHSFSALNLAETCPRKYEARYVFQQKEVMTSDQSWGIRVHKALEDSVKAGTPLPPEMHSYEWGLKPVIQAKRGGVLVLLEHRVAVAQDGTPVTYNSDMAYARAIIDTTMLGTRSAMLLDYKSGKRRPSTQLEFSSWIGFRQWPAIQTITTQFVYLKLGKEPGDGAVYTREKDLPVIDEKIRIRLHKLEKMQKSGVFPPTPNGLCANYCGVKSCEYWGKRGGR